MERVLTAPDDPLVYWRLPDAPDGAWGARRALADAIRALAERVVATEADEAALRAAEALVSQAIGTLPPGPGSFARFLDGTYGAFAGEHVDRTALMGRSNPIAPPMRVEVEDGVTVCRIAFGEVHAGAPGMAHGGWVASVLDQLAGYALMTTGRRGFTGKLAVRYLRPTPLNRELLCTARVGAIGARSVEIGMQIALDGAVVVEGEALMVQMDAERAQRVIRGEDR